ncbi:hypothetical protein [Actinokineospora enzanensis]|uniref:hypothetical protein n=1 Tax=Actinokineospora enzanensis TaxID=155975 RepID=UPI000366B58E|nr:hypothetical protein [Actinokineospora enzanensis]
MAIDPAHRPILGDTEPADPPAPVRAASVLLLLHVTVTGAHLALLGDNGLPAVLVPMALVTWFALSIRAGRDWARPAALLVAGLTLVLMSGFADGLAGLSALAVSALLVLGAAHLVYRVDVRAYFIDDPAGAESAPGSRTRPH